MNDATKRPDDHFELCPRCGASEQATHSLLCQARDGTPTDLPDSEVRRLLAEQRDEEIERAQRTRSLRLLSDDRRRQIKGECLAKYAEGEPRLCGWIDCGVPGYEDSTDRAIEWGSTWELMTWERMHDAPVRILVAEGYSGQPERVAELLTEAAALIRDHPQNVRQSFETDAEEYLQRLDKTEIPF